MSVVLITGASRGIGRAAALLFAAQGSCVGVNYNQSREAAKALVGEIRVNGGHALALQADVSDFSACAAMVKALKSEFGFIDTLINNAGVACDKLFTDTLPEDWRRTFDVNMGGAYNCTAAVLPEMIQKKRGTIVNVSSIWGIAGGSCEVAYSASKAALIGFTKALAKEAGPSGIRVNCVAPGVIDTDMNAGLRPEDVCALNEHTPMGRMGTPKEAAESILFLASPAASFLTGQVISPNGGFLI